MKKTVLLIIASFSVAFLQAQQPFSKDQQEVQQTIVKMFQALSGRDSTALKLHCAPDVQFYEYGEIWNLDTMIRKAIVMNTAPDFRRTNSFEFIETVTGETTAWATYRLHSVITAGGAKRDIRWLETVILVKQRNQWKIRHLHSTRADRN